MSVATHSMSTSSQGRSSKDSPYMVVVSQQMTRPAALEALYDGIYEKAVRNPKPRRSASSRRSRSSA